MRPVTAPTTTAKSQNVVCIDMGITSLKQIVTFVVF
jgi:hypothetical protein